MHPQRPPIVGTHATRVAYIYLSSCSLTLGTSGYVPPWELVVVSSRWAAARLNDKRVDCTKPKRWDPPSSVHVKISMGGTQEGQKKRLFFMHRVGVPTKQTVPPLPAAIQPPDFR